MLTRRLVSTLLASLLLLAGCRSRPPWREIEIELESGSEVVITGSANMTGGDFEVRLRGPAKAKFLRDGASTATEPKIIQIPDPAPAP